MVKEEINGVMHEPWERLEIELPDEFAGAVMARLMEKGGTVVESEGDEKKGMKVAVEIAS